MRLPLTSIIILGLFTNAFTQFRQTTWAMDKEMIKSIETAAYIGESDNSLTYKLKLDQWDAWCVYYFDEGNFFLAEYLIDITHKDKNLYMDDYRKISRLLAEKYGKPEKDDDYVWLDNTHQNDTEKHGFAVSVGHLKLNNRWISPNMHIVLVLKGNNYNSELKIQYINPYYKKNQVGEGF